MSGQVLTIRPLQLADESQAIAGHSELALENWEYLLGWAPAISWSEYVDYHHRQSLGLELEPGRVPATFMLAHVGEDRVGRVSIRHELTDYLLERGGHIGYGVRPAFRRLGYATRILEQSLAVTDALGIKQVLVTCNDENLGSARTIEKCGGVLENKIEINGGEIVRRYWINRS